MRAHEPSAGAKTVTFFEEQIVARVVQQVVARARLSGGELLNGNLYSPAVRVRARWLGAVARVVAEKLNGQAERMSQ